MIKEYENMTDEELITISRESGGDERIIDFLIEKYKDLVRKKAQSMFILGADKDDLIQEGMIGLFKAVRDYDAGRDASFFTFADLCVSRQIVKAVEAGNRKKHMPLNSYVSIYDDNATQGETGSSGGVSSVMGVILSLSDTNPEDVIIDRENTDVLEQKIVSSLSEMEKKVFNLLLVGMGSSEIAKILGKDDKSTGNTIQRIRTKVKKLL